MEDIAIQEPVAEAPIVDKYDEIDSLIMGDSENEQAEDEREPNQEQPPVQEMEPEPEQETDDGTEEDTTTDEEREIDYTQKVKMPDGMDEMTIGELKDRVYDIRNQEAQIEKQTNANMVTQDRLRSIVDAVGLDNMPQQAQNLIKQRTQEHLSREQDLMLTAIPQWKDATTFQTDRAEMLSLVSEYGMSEREFNGITDHKAIKMILDFTNSRVRTKAAELKLTPSKGKGKPKPKVNKAKVDQAEFDRVANKGSRTEKLHIIDDLIG